MTTSNKILVCGATGQLGREVVRLLAERGHAVRVLTRDRARAAALGDVEVHVGDARRSDTLRGLCDGISAVFSSVGASVSPRFGAGWRGFGAVDLPANTNLLAAARDAGVGRFVYVAAHVVPETAGYRYFAAHEEVARRVLAAPLDGRVLRPTAFFSALRPFLDMARGGGKVMVIGDGRPRSNPIHDADLADAALDMLLAPPGEGPRERSLGGPDVLSREDIAGLACDAWGLPRRFRKLPPWLMRAGSVMMVPMSPRLSQLVRFATEVSVRDLVAPAHGQRRLGAWFCEQAKGLSA